MNIYYRKLEEGTILYRTALTTGLQSRKCEDTTKTGLYFSTNPLIPVCMLLENREKPFLIKLRLKCPIFIADGKYSFREINPQRYFTSSGQLILHQNVTEEENISHIGLDVQPLKKDEKTGELQLLTEKFVRGGNELFLSSFDLEARRVVEILEVYDFAEPYKSDVKELEKFILSIDFSTDFEQYKPILKRIM